jgi:hypothetical protein
MNNLAQELARRKGLVSVSEACREYGTTKDKLRDLVVAGLLTCEESDLDRRVKLLKVRELDKLLGRKRSAAARNGNGHQAVEAAED